MIILGGTGGTDPTSAPKDRFCGQVLRKDQKTILIWKSIRSRGNYNLVMGVLSLRFKICKPKIYSQALGYCPDATCSPKELGPVNVQGYSCFISFQRNVLVSVPSTLLLNWLHLKVISTVTPFSIGVVTDNTEVGLTDLNDKYLILCFFQLLAEMEFFKMLNKWAIQAGKPISRYLVQTT